MTRKLSERWRRLPNAPHLQRVFATYRSHPQLWRDVGGGHVRYSNDERVDPWSVCCDRLHDIGRSGEWGDANDVLLSIHGDLMRNSEWFDSLLHGGSGISATDALYRTGDAMIALVVYDNAGSMMAMDSDVLRTWGAITDNPAAALLWPAVQVFEQIGAEFEAGSV